MKLAKREEIRRHNKLWNLIEKYYNSGNHNKHIRSMYKYIHRLRTKYALWKLYDHGYETGLLIRRDLIQLAWILRSLCRKLSIKVDHNYQSNWKWYLDTNFTIDFLCEENQIGIA